MVTSSVFLARARARLKSALAEAPGMRSWSFLAMVPAFCLAACELAPPYERPAMEIPAKFKEAGNWRMAHPADDEPHGEWWRCFGDETLDGLEEKVDSANQDLIAALAVYDQARAYVAKAQAALYPAVQHNEQVSANRQSAHREPRGASEPTYYGINLLDLQASYEIDVWGRVRDTVAAAAAQAQASAATLESVRLNLHAELARDYVSLRGLDREAKLLSDTVVAYKAALALTRERLTGQIAAPVDVARAEFQLDTAQAQLAEIAGPRALLEHAIATLTGEAASAFSIPPSTKATRIPTFPPGIPSTLLERRPDIAAAERQTAAANESIGVARAAFFPRFTLNLAGGTQDTWFNFFSLSNSFWAVGPAVSLPIFDAGLRLAELTSTKAAYRETVANYRQAVLRAIQETEDALALLRSLKRESRNTDAAAIAAQRASDLAFILYRDGAANYLDVVTAQTAALDAKRAALQIETRRLQTSVTLILALGGDFSVRLANETNTHDE